MLKWFAANPGGSATCLPTLLSAFSHYSIFHLGILEQTVLLNIPGYSINMRHLLNKTDLTSVSRIILFMFLKHSALTFICLCSVFQYLTVQFSSILLYCFLVFNCSVFQYFTVLFSSIKLFS